MARAMEMAATRNAASTEAPFLDDSKTAPPEPAGSAAAAVAMQQPAISDDDVSSDTSDEGMAGVELGVKEGESAEQHKARLRKQLKERVQRSKDARESKEERRTKGKGRDGEAREKPRPRATLKK